MFYGFLSYFVLLVFGVHTDGVPVPVLLNVLLESEHLSNFFICIKKKRYCVHLITILSNANCKFVLEFLIFSLQKTVVYNNLSHLLISIKKLAQRTGTI